MLFYLKLSKSKIAFFLHKYISHLEERNTFKNFICIMEFYFPYIGILKIHFHQEIHFYFLMLNVQPCLFFYKECA